MKRCFYIILFIGFSFSGFSQKKPLFQADDAVRVARLYPNPATNFINLEFSEKPERPLSVIIYSFIGKKVDDIRVADKRITIQLSDYYRGIYIFQVRDDRGNIIESGKFQVIR